ncbi:MAG: helicase C-terminal domain-containing protein, partial [Bacteroidota bacterium]
SIGPMSAAGHYVRHCAKHHHLNLDHKATKAELETLLGILQTRSDPNEAVDPERPRLCYLHHQQAGKVDLYQLDLANITWVLGDKKTPVTDKVRTRSFLEQQARPNPFFQALYQLPVDKLKQFQAKEHTGQVPSGDRQEAEQAFRKADIKALYCSPTMELGIDIDDLSVVHMRNVPPVPANYVQRSGRAGRKGQGALILTFCSSFSDHDQYYFQHQSEMVSGKVAPQQLDLQNEDLLRSHLHALYLEHCGITALNKSLTEVIDLTQDPELPLKPLIKQQLQLPTWKQQQLETHFSNIIAGMQDQLEGHYWFHADWVRAQIEAAPRTFDRALDRWRILYREAEQ